MLSLQQALQSVPVQKAATLATQVKEQIAAVHFEARRIADEKKAAKPTTEEPALTEPAKEA